MRLTDDDCVVTGAQGVARINRETLAAMLKNVPYAIDHFEVMGAEVRSLSGDVAILAYKVREELTVEGKPVSFVASDASAWVRRDGQWRCALHTESISGDPFGRDKRA